MKTVKEQREDGKVKAETRSIFSLNTAKLESLSLVAEAFVMRKGD